MNQVFERIHRMRWWLVLGVFAGCIVPRGLAQLDLGGSTPPVAKKVQKVTRIHGDTRIDEYYWLREKSNPEVIRYLEAENAYTAAVMKPTEPFQEKLYQEMLARIKQTDLGVPYHLGEWWYYSRTEKGKQYPIHCRKRGTLHTKEEITLDLNELAKGHPFLGMAEYVVSDDGNLLAYTTDVTGFREYTLQIKDLRSGQLLPDRIAKVQTVAWAADNHTLFYVKEDAAKRPYQLCRHELGTAKENVIYEEKDELYRLTVQRSRDKDIAFATSRSSTTSEVRCVSARSPEASWRIISPRKEGHEYYLDHRNGLFYIRTNRNALNFRLVTAREADPVEANWKEIVPHRSDVYLENVDLFAKYGVLSERVNGLPQRRILDLDKGTEHTIAFGEPAYSISAEPNPEFQTNEFRFRYQSLVTPETVFGYDMDTRKKTVLKQTEVLGGYRPQDYITERIVATASEGARIPISVVYKKGARDHGPAPLLLYGYGSYGFSLPVNFQPQRVSLLNRGVIFALGHIRGGSDMGRAWYEHGKMMCKRNTFTDFIACAEHLIAQKYTGSDRLVIEGGSAGGLLIGAVVNMRPELFKAAVLHVPFVDVVNTMLDALLPLTVQEYLEWGNPNIKEQYDYIKTYCPYTNLGARAYPAILVRTSLNDSQVMYWEPAKYVAKLRTLKTDKNPLLFKITMAGGHGGASGRYDALRDQALVTAFVLTELRIKE